jgi:hypothetical protein
MKLKVPPHNATIASVLRALAGSLFHKFGFFMDCLHEGNSFSYKKLVLCSTK